MNAADPTAPFEALLAPLLHRPPTERLEAIARLAQSLKRVEEPVVATAIGPLPTFIGAWANDPEADSMEAAIVASRHFGAKPELTQWP